MRAVHEGFLQTVEDNQGPGGDVPVVVPQGYPAKGKCGDIAWTAAFPQITNFLHRYYGDVRVVERHWESLVKYMSNLIAHDQPLGVATCDQFQDWLCGQKQSCCTKQPAGSKPLREHAMPLTPSSQGPSGSKFTKLKTLISIKFENREGVFLEHT